MRIGYFLSGEEFTPSELLDQARMAERAGFDGLWISDHFHPWTDVQGESVFVWSVIGALSQVTTLPITTAVTCPTVRVHPAIVAQAAATSAALLDGRFVLGVGSGEALNEHILGDRWPSVDVRLDMLDEAIAVMRKLFGGSLVEHHGRYYTVENARLYTRPRSPVPIYVSAFGPEAATLAGRVADGMCSVQPDAEAVEIFRDAGGAGKPVQGGYKVCVDDDPGAARKRVLRTWPNEVLPGQLAQELPMPRHFTQAAEMLTEDDVAASVVCGTDVDAHIEAFQRYARAGFDQIYVNQIGPNQQQFFDLYEDKILPRLREHGAKGHDTTSWRK